MAESASVASVAVIYIYICIYSVEVSCYLVVQNDVYDRNLQPTE